MAAGMLTTMEEYKFHAGRIAGLRMALDQFDEVNKRINAR
jgi:hypothetical protein